MKKQRWGIIWRAAFATLPFVAVSGLALQIYFLAAGSVVNYFFATYVSTLSSIVGVLPISINGLGLVELPQLIAMETRGVEAEITIAVAVSARIMGLLISGVGGITYLVESWISTINRDDNSQNSS